MTGNKFIGFNEKTKMGMRQSVFGLCKDASDYIPTMEFFDSTFTSVQEGAFAYVNDPIPGWANLKDCGDFPCTAPANVLLQF